MAGILGALNAGKTALQANQVGLEVTGNNVANVNTPGYSRQQIVYSNVPTFSQKGFFIGQGVRVSAVQREHDQFLENQLITRTAEYGFEKAQGNTLSELERIFSIDDDNLSADIGSFFESVQKLANNPGDRVMRSTVLHKGQNLCTRFNHTADELNSLQDNLSKSITAKIEGINSNLKKIAELNGRIQTIEVTGQSANAQRDKQEALIREIARETGAGIVSSKKGMLSLHLPGGLPLVQGTSAAKLGYRSAGSSLTLAIDMEGDVRKLAIAGIGGEIRGLLNLREEMIPEVRDSLDRLAYDITQTFNTQHALGVDLQGDTGGNFFTAPPNTGQLAHPSRPEYHDTARTMSVAITDGNRIAAGNTSAPGDNENALALADIYDKKIGEVTFATQYGKIASTIGVAKNRNEISVNGAEAAMVQLQNLRDSASAVSLDEEMVNLIQFQRSFQSSAKFLSTVDEMMETLINLR